MIKAPASRYDIYAIILLTIFLRYWQIFSSEYPNGWDGCFYEMQLDCWLKTGEMHSSNFSTIYFLLKPIALLSSPGIAYKIVAVFASSLFSILIVLYSKKTINRIETIFVWLFSLASPLLLFVSHQFTKNLLGLNLIILYFVLDKKWWKTALLLILTFFTHRVAFVILSLVIVWDLSQKIKLRNFIYILFMGLATSALLSFIPGLPHPFDYSRIVNELNLSATWYPFDFFKAWPSKSFSFIWYLEVAIFHTTLFLGGYFAIKRKKVSIVFFIVLILLVPLFNFSTGSLGYRLYLNAFCLIFLLIPFVFQLPPIRYAFIIITFISLPFGLFSYDHSKFDPPMKKYKMIANEAGQVLEGVDSVSLIIAHKGIKEQIILKTRHNALNWAQDHSDRYPNCFRIVYGVTDKEIIHFQENRQSQWRKIFKNYYLTPDSNWTDFQQSLKKTNDTKRLEELNTWLNPHETKPLFLR